MDVYNASDLSAAANAAHGNAYSSFMVAERCSVIHPTDTETEVETEEETHTPLAEKTQKDSCFLLSQLSAHMIRMEKKIDTLAESFMRAIPVERIGKRVQTAVLTEEATQSLSKVWDAVALAEAADSERVIGATITKWRSGGRFGFATAEGTDVFVHATALRSAEDGIIGRRMVLKVIKDKAYKSCPYRAVQAHTECDWIELQLKERAEHAAAEAVKAAEMAKRKAETSMRALEHALQAEVMAKVARPPGLAVQPQRVQAQCVDEVVDVPKIVHQQARAGGA